MSTQEKLELIGSLTASADLTAKQYTLVKVSGVNTVASNVLATTKSIGVLQNKPNTGEAATVAIEGSITKVLAGGVVTAGNEVMSDTSGRVVNATGVGAHVVGVALETAANANEIVRVLLVGARVIP